MDCLVEGDKLSVRSLDMVDWIVEVRVRAGRGGEISSSYCSSCLAAGCMLSAGGGGVSRGTAGGSEALPPITFARAAAGLGAAGLLGSGGIFLAGRGGLGSSSAYGAGGAAGLEGRLGGAGAGSGSGSGSGPGDGCSLPPPAVMSI